MLISLQEHCAMCSIICKVEFDILRLLHDDLGGSGPLRPKAEETIPSQCFVRYNSPDDSSWYWVVGNLLHRVLGAETVVVFVFVSIELLDDFGPILDYAKRRCAGSARLSELVNKPDEPILLIR